MGLVTCPNGDKNADSLEYVPLPGGVNEFVRNAWARN